MEVLLGEALTAENQPVAMIKVSPIAQRRVMHLLQVKVEKATPKTKWKEYSGMALLKYIAAFHSVYYVLVLSALASKEAMENSRLAERSYLYWTMTKRKSFAAFKHHVRACHFLRER